MALKLVDIINKENVCDYIYCELDSDKNIHLYRYYHEDDDVYVVVVSNAIKAFPKFIYRETKTNEIQLNSAAFGKKYVIYVKDTKSSFIDFPNDKISTYVKDDNLYLDIENDESVENFISFVYDTINVEI